MPDYLNINKLYYEKLNEFINIAEELPNAGYAAYQKIISCVNINMTFEAFGFNDTGTNPYAFMLPVVDSHVCMLTQYQRFAHIFDLTENREEEKKMEERHRELFQRLWISYNHENYDYLIELMIERFRNNGLNESFFKGNKCLDLGCGNGRTCFSMAQLGAKEVYGIDYGEDSIRFAKEKVKQKQLDKIHFSVGSVYDLAFEDNSFEVAISNGVFHHLEDSGRAINEVARILKPEGFFWLYIQGEGGMFNELYDAAKQIMKNIPQEFTFKVLTEFGLTVNKRYHLMDSFYATYLYSKWDRIVRTLKEAGFDDIVRFEGRRETDFDLTRITNDPYGYEKWGEGEFRIGCIKKP